MVPYKINPVLRIRRKPVVEAVYCEEASPERSNRVRNNLLSKGRFTAYEICVSLLAAILFILVMVVAIGVAVIDQLCQAVNVIYTHVRRGLSRSCNDQAL